MAGILRVLLVCLTILGLSSAGGGESSKEQNCPQPSTVTCTVTKTSYSEKTVEKEKTVYSEKTVYVTSKQVVPTTIISTAYEQVPTTITAYRTVTAVVTQPVTVYVTTTVLETVVNSRTIVNTQTIANTVTNVNTQYLTSAVTQVQTATVTIVNVVTTTVVSACPTPSSTLSGLVLCTSRIVNPTYTPASALPSNYLFGCPPGTVCTPPQENCNFERGLPAKGYVCSPNECKKSPPLTPLSEIKALVNRGPTCAWLTPTPGYFNVNPIPWGLSYAIFNIFGQPTCPAIYSSSSSSSSASSTWATWSPPPPPPKSSSTEWEGWPSSSPSPSHVQEYSSKVTPRAVLAKRAAEVYPNGCYQFCNQAVQAYQAYGIDTGPLCNPDSSFIPALNALSSCASESAGQGFPVGDTDLDSARDLCTGGARLAMRDVQVTQAAPLAMTTSPSEAVLVASSSSSSSNATLAKPTASTQANSAARPDGGNSIFMAMLFSLLGFLFGI